MILSGGGQWLEGIIVSCLYYSLSVEWSLDKSDVVCSYISTCLLDATSAR